jgi:hypothetical protein
MCEKFIPEKKQWVKEKVKEKATEKVTEKAKAKAKGRLQAGTTVSSAASPTRETVSPVT